MLKYTLQPKKNCKTCHGRGKMRLIVHGETHIVDCKCCRLRDENGNSIKLYGGIKNS